MADTDWKDLMKGSFGNVDRIFAGHPLDKERAVQFLAACVAAGVSWNDVSLEILKWFEEEGMDKAYAKERLAEVEQKLKPWLG